MRAAIFIDGAYLLNRVHEAEIAADYGKLAEYFLLPLRRNVPLDLLRCYFYDCPPWMAHTPSEDEKRRMAAHDRFVTELEDLDRWSVRLGKLEKRREDGRDVFAQKRVDVLLAVDMVRHAAAGHIQHAVLVAGDSDFVPAVLAAKECGATVTLWCAQDRTPHRDLLVAADEVCYFDWNHFPVRQRSARPEAVAPPVQEPAPPRPRLSSPPHEPPKVLPHQEKQQAISKKTRPPMRLSKPPKADANQASPSNPEAAEPKNLVLEEMQQSSSEQVGAPLKRRRRGKRGGRRHKKETPPSES